MHNIAITIGDPAGVGPEVALKAALSPQVQDLCCPVLIGSAKLLQQQSQELGLSWSDEWVVSSVQAQSSLPLQILSLDEHDFASIKRGQASAESGEASMSYLKAVVDLLKSKQVQAVATAPINKAAWRMAGYEDPGHTEFFAQSFGVSRYLMSFFSDPLKIAVLTRHLPLKDVANDISQDKVLNMLQLIQEQMAPYCQDGVVKIGVCGLNPHAGEGGKIGHEEIDVIVPAIEQARHKGLHVEGPFPADSFFIPSRLKRYDFVLAMYHDQGLIPFKMMAFETGINVTLGLPYVRTSVDHGTAYDIVGQNKALPGSMIAAVHWALRLL